MNYTNSEQFVKGKLSDEPHLFPVSSELEKDDDDPLSLRSLSITFIGIMVALLTIILPCLSVLLGRPTSQSNEITFYHLIKKDGS